MTHSLESIQLILELNTRLLPNTLEGITEKQWKERLSNHNNPFGWIAAHTVSSRHAILAFLGKPSQNPFVSFFENQKPYDPNVAYPSMEETKKEWARVSELLHAALRSPDQQALSAPAAFKLPISDSTMFGMVCFFAEHESYEIGQLGFLKKYHTKEAMKYT